MTDQLLIIKQHLRSAVLGEAVPALGCGALADLMEALGAPLDEAQPFETRKRALAQIGLDTLALLLERTTSGLKAQRELALLRAGQHDA